MRQRRACCIVALLLLGLATLSPARADVKVNADYPGGNIAVDRIEGDTVTMHQELRDTGRWWFYWNFRVSGAAGKTLTFRFTNRNVFGTRGPAVSMDGGLTWSWLGTKTVKGASFSYKFAPDAKSVRFAFSLPYQGADLGRFMARHKGNKHFAVHELCKTRKNRSVERIHVGRLDGQPKHRVLITCRHHACESTASYVVEGMMEALLAKTDDGKWFRENVEVMVVPFMDKDGVEDGDQGKSRKPRDHCRDYVGKSLYPSVRTLRTFVPKWSAGRLRIAHDFHCPYIRGNKIYQVGSSHKNIWAEQKKFGGILESIANRALPYKASADMPFGKSWNKAGSYKAGKSFFQWADELKGIHLSSAIEIPYANAGNTTITPDTARAFGDNFVQAMRKYLEQLPAEQRRDAPSRGIKFPISEGAAPC
ncbi:MAG: peptidase M14 [Phycisphaerae bacterium]|nr:peptidase M14 [Phycisphaerae bacterium]